MCLIHLSPLWGLLLGGSRRGLYTFRPSGGLLLVGLCGLYTFRLSEALAKFHISTRQIMTNTKRVFVQAHLALIWLNAIRAFIALISVRKVYRERIPRKPKHQRCDRYEDRIGFIYNPPRSENVLKLTLMVIG